MGIYSLFFISGGLCLTAIVLLFILSQLKNKAQLKASLGMVLFEVKMPKYENEEGQQKPDIKLLIETTEQLLAQFIYLKKPNFFKKFAGAQPDRVALEVASEVGASDIRFYIATPKHIALSMEKNIQGVFPQAVVEKVAGDYTIFEPQAKTAAGVLFLKDSFYFPIKTYKSMEGDPLSGITNALSKIKPKEGAAVQIILQPTDLNIKKTSEKILENIGTKGHSAKAAVYKANQGNFLKATALLGDAIAGLSTQKKQDKPQEDIFKNQNEAKPSEFTLQGLQQKAQKPILEANIRLIGVGVDQLRAQEVLGNLESAFSQFHSNLNSFKLKQAKGRALKRLIYNFSFRAFNKKERAVLNLEEIASLFHFPLTNIASPNIAWVRSKEIAPPNDLPTVGVNLIGKAAYRGEEVPFCFASREDRRRHFYLVGQTGTGKSSLLKEMIRHDLEAGEGVAVIDPNGDLIEDTLANIPPQRHEDVVLFEPFDMQSPMGLNMLEWQTPEQKDFAISEMIAIFSKLFPPEFIGPMFEHYMRNAMLALMADKNNPGTLVEIPRMFTDKEYMEERVKHLDDPLARSFWLKEWAQTTGQTRSDMLGYVVSKVGRFVENTMMRNIIGQPKSAFDLGDIMDNKKIFLANLSKGLTGEINSSLLGLILVSKMQLAAFRRASISQEQRQDFYLYIDEFQNFATDTIAIILSEARKYKLNLILAHQFIPQLTEEIKNAVVGNVGSMGAFRIGALDAEFLEKQFAPEFSRFDLLNTDNFQLIIKMMINGSVSAPFKAKIYKPKEGSREQVAELKRLAKLKYGKPKAEVEKEIMERSRLGA